MAKVTDTAKRDVQHMYVVLSCVYVVLTAALWTGVGFAIKFADGENQYFAGAAAAASLDFICLLNTVRVYLNVMELGRTKQKNKQIRNMIGLQNSFTTLALMTSFAGAILSGFLGVNYCSFYSRAYRSRCINVDETRLIAKALIAGCAVSFICNGMAMGWHSAAMTKLGLQRRPRTIKPHPHGLISIQGIPQGYPQGQVQSVDLQMQQGTGWPSGFAKTQPSPNFSTVPPPPPDYFSATGNAQQHHLQNNYDSWGFQSGTKY